MKNLDYNLEHDSHSRVSYQNAILSKQGNCYITFSLRTQFALLETLSCACFLPYASNHVKFRFE